MKPVISQDYIVVKRTRKRRKPLRFEEEPCSWTVHVAVCDSIARELVLPPGDT